MPAAVRSTTMLTLVRMIAFPLGKRLATATLSQTRSDHRTFFGNAQQFSRDEVREFAIAPKRLIAFSQGIAAKALDIVCRRHRASHP